MTQMMTDSRIKSNVAMAIPSGFDGGNTDTCFVCFQDNIEKSIIIPSTVVEIEREKIERLRSAVASHVDGGEELQFDSYKQDIILEYQDTAYYVGYTAMRQKKLASTNLGDDSRYYQIAQLIRLLASSALTVNLPYYEINVLTTVPYGYFMENLSLGPMIQERLSGVHKFKLNGKEYQAVVNIKAVLVEGAPALVIYGAKSASRRRIVIDGGGYTTELLTFDGKDPVPELCRGEEMGVENIGDYVSDQLLQKHGRRISKRERSDILRAYGSRNAQIVTPYPEIVCGRYRVEPAELHGLCRIGATKLAKGTAEKAAELWKRTNGVVAGDIGDQYHLGGSVHFTNDILRETDMPNLISVANAEKANARGCARLAKLF